MLEVLQAAFAGNPAKLRAKFETILSEEGMHLLVDLITEAPHRLQFIAWESELPVLVLGGA